MKLLIVSCGLTKQPGTHQAHALYTGCLFRAASSYAADGRWVILSALHGLIEPSALIEAYDLSMADRLRQQPAQLAAYRAEVHQQLLRICRAEAIEAIELHTGRLYADLVRACSPVPVSDPLCGLTVGRRLQWYKHNRKVHQ